MEQEVFDFWKFLAGIGLFLWGMNQLEGSIKELAGKPFRNLLQKSTNTAWKGILIGALITAVLQSSSLVTLMVLAFLGAGVINLKNAIGVILGANLGTTMTAWIVATLGFKFSVASFAMPFLGIGSLMFIFFSSRPMLKNLGAFTVGFGLLFLGLDFMKLAIEAVADQIDLSQFDKYGLWVYLLIGLVVTALIQSSSAMVVIILSAMSAGVIGLEEGAVLIIGANIGTTVTVGIGALNGPADKKRLALAHFLFNLITGFLVFFFIRTLIDVTMSLFAIKDPLMELVLLNTAMNLIGILIFFPFINQLEKWLKHQFGEEKQTGVAIYIGKVNPNIPEAAVAAMEKDIHLAFDLTADFIFKIWEGDTLKDNNFTIWRKLIQQPYDLLSQYLRIKALEDELTAYHIKLQEVNLDHTSAQKSTSLMLALRTMVYASKDIKDVMHNIKEMQDTDDDQVKELLDFLKTFTYEQLNKMKTYIDANNQVDRSDWVGMHDVVYQNTLNELYQNARKHQPEIPISTLTNVIKQVISSLDNLGNSIIHWKEMEKMVIDTMKEEHV
ncbi:Na+/phosphate symporter [Belliella baltica DSM 15883]|uniref:Na+/phosphate symporter n=1 Tax=Belliella baltica (strain DSM 15883 / CIP 108006 / LMG 21964 / BA134) TaxID=866536 RepID=I3Z9W5_BELBD|nr:Na/Pi symporter [Belliella baltica]AFL86033.1 Na+/phosphate symporter [Belliella baltica DSM 15883]